MAGVMRKPFTESFPLNYQLKRIQSLKMSQIQPLHWQKHSEVAKTDAGWAAEPSSWPGKGRPHPGTDSHLSLHCPGLVGSSLSQSSLLARQRTFWCFVGIKSCTGSDEHQSWSKVSSKTMESGTRREEGRSGAFFLWERVSTSNTSLHLLIITPLLCFVWIDLYQILPNYHILLLPWHQWHQQSGGKFVKPCHHLLGSLWSHIIISWCFPFTKLQLHH